MNLLVILIGGGLGACLRYLFSSTAYHLLGRAFPYGIISCNVLGSFLIGFFAILFLHKIPGAGLWQNAIITGFLGGFTTFSSFSLDTITLLQQGHLGRGLIYIVLSVMLSLIAVVLGILLGRLL